jgi:hypothetical protein
MAAGCGGPASPPSADNGPINLHIVSGSENQELVRFVDEQKSWTEIGLAELCGKISVISTDPTRSHSGNMFAALLAKRLNGENVVTDDTVDPVIQKVGPFFKKLGPMEHFSGGLFEKHLAQGVGAWVSIQSARGRRHVDGCEGIEPAGHD